MLHGEIKINGTEIAEWTAVNVGSNTDPQFHQYRCTLTYRDQQGYLCETGEFFIWGHHKGSGPVSLAARVLGTGGPLLKRKRPVAVEDYLNGKDERRRNA